MSRISISNGFLLLLSWYRSFGLEVMLPLLGSSQQHKSYWDNPDSCGILCSLVNPVLDVRIWLSFFLFPLNSMFTGFTTISWDLCFRKAGKNDVVNLPHCFPNVYPDTKTCQNSIFYQPIYFYLSSSHLAFPILFNFINQVMHVL